MGDKEITYDDKLIKRNDDIRQTLQAVQKSKHFTEKRKLESQELQFFLMSSDDRMLRVKHGGKLFEVLKDQTEVNSQPLQLIEAAIPRQYQDFYDKDKEEERTDMDKSQSNSKAPQ